MQILDEAEIAEHEKRIGVLSRNLVWFEARNRTTGLTETIGLWDGGDVRVFTIDGDARTYYGPSIIQLPEIVGGVGLDVRQSTMTVPHLTPEVQNLIRAFEPRLAPVEMHKAVFSLETNELLAVRRVYKGAISKAPIKTGGDGETGEARLTLVSAARSLTRKLSLYRSNADQLARSATDTAREYASTTGLKEVWWGEGRVVNQPPQPIVPVSQVDSSSWGP